MWTVELAREFEPELLVLPSEVRIELLAQARVVEQFGPVAGRPRVDTFKGSKHANMKELRFDAGGGVWRVAFAFDPERKAILLVAGDKGGKGERDFYRRLIAVADKRFDAHLAGLGRRPAGSDREVEMPRTLNEVIADLPEEERAKIEARARELISEEMSLQDLRKAIGKTQTAVARRLKVGQDAVSKLETRSDMYISTLRSVLKAMGGDLELIARFPGRPPVRLQELGGASPRRKRDKRAA